MSNTDSLLRKGADVAVNLPSIPIFPARVSRVLKDGKEIAEMEWVGGEEVELVLTTGQVVSSNDVLCAPHHCEHCDSRLKEGPIGSFSCNCEAWILRL